MWQRTGTSVLLNETVEGVRFFQLTKYVLCCMAIKHIIVLFVETPCKKFTWCFHKQNYYKIWLCWKKLNCSKRFYHGWKLCREVATGVCACVGGEWVTSPPIIQKVSKSWSKWKIFGKIWSKLQFKHGKSLSKFGNKLVTFVQSLRLKNHSQPRCIAR
jgi:hypothetical protein